MGQAVLAWDSWRVTIHILGLCGQGRSSWLHDVCSRSWSTKWCQFDDALQALSYQRPPGANCDYEVRKYPLVQIIKIQSSTYLSRDEIVSPKGWILTAGRSQERSPAQSTHNAVSRACYPSSIGSQHQQAVQYILWKLYHNCAFLEFMNRRWLHSYATRFFLEFGYDAGLGITENVTEISWYASIARVHAILSSIKLHHAILAPDRVTHQ